MSFHRFEFFQRNDADGPAALRIGRQEVSPHHERHIDGLAVGHAEVGHQGDNVHQFGGGADVAKSFRVTDRNLLFDAPRFTYK